MLDARSRLNDLTSMARDLVASLTVGSMESTAYDTAWVARLRGPDGSPVFPKAIDWLLTRQHADGSWGGPIAFAHDRVISTLAAITALSDLPRYADRVAKGCEAVRLWLPKTPDDVHETVAFELLAPALLNDCRRAGLDLPYEDFAFVEARRQEKLARIPAEFVYSPASPLAFSLEHRGDDLDMSRLDGARGANGSFGNSPSATAYVLMKRNDPSAWAYLHGVATRSRDGGYCNVQPFDVFEHAWVLYHLRAGGIYDPAYEKLLDFLEKSWTSIGVGWNSAGITSDADDTSLTLRVLRDAGRQADASVLRRFLNGDHFVCYHGERTTCATANVHVLDALAVCDDLEDRDQLTAIAAGYLDRTRLASGSWNDKWHASEYYPACHALLAYGKSESGHATRHFLLNTQRPDGGWGVAGSTAEETAYGLLGLAEEPVGAIENIEAARAYLWANLDGPYPPLWIGKGLYTPTAVVRSAVLAALARAERILSE